MPRFIDLSIIGDKSLIRKLSKMEDKVIKRVVKKGMVMALKPVMEEAKRLVPYKTGNLRNSIKTVQYSGRHHFGGAVRTGTRKQLKIKANATGYYPAAIEYGTRTRPARSFLREALARKKKKALQILASSIEIVLREQK